MSGSSEPYDEFASGYWFKVSDLYGAGEAPKGMKPKAKTKEEKKDEPHQSNMTLVSGNLFKGTTEFTDGDKAVAMYYPWNGWNYIGMNEKGDRDIYRGKNGRGPYKLYRGYAFYDKDYGPNFNVEYRVKDLAEMSILKAIRAAKKNDKASQATLAWLKRLDARAKAKVDKVKQFLPYPWEAHHILPMSSFMRHLESADQDLILQTDYDINSGQNIIFLPAKEDCMQYHKLPGHWSDHPKYTVELAKHFTEIADAMDELRDDSEPHETIKSDMEKQLHSLEDTMFQHLASLGPTRLI